MPSRRQVRRALELHADDLAAHPNVVAVGADWDTRPKDDSGVRGPLEHALAVYVAETPRDHTDDPPIPSSVTIPARSGVHVIPVHVKQLGVVQPEAQTPAETEGSPEAGPATEAFGPE